MVFWPIDIVLARCVTIFILPIHKSTCYLISPILGLFVEFGSLCCYKHCSDLTLNWQIRSDILQHISQLDWLISWCTVLMQLAIGSRLQISRHLLEIHGFSLQSANHGTSFCIQLGCLFWTAAVSLFERLEHGVTRCLIHDWDSGIYFHDFHIPSTNLLHKQFC